MKKEEKKIFEIILERVFRNVKWTAGKLYVDNKYFSATIEDTDRNLYQGMTEEQVKERKVYGETCIPRGRYQIAMDIVSPKFVKKKWYKDNFEGKLPRLLDVIGFSGVLLHPLNTPEDSFGCIGVGEPGDTPGTIKNSRNTFKKLYNILKEHYEKGEEIWITIK